MKYIRVNLPKKTKDLGPQNCKILMKEIIDDTKIWKDILCSWGSYFPLPGQNIDYKLIITVRHRKLE